MGCRPRAHLDRLRVPADARNLTGHNKDPFLKESACLVDRGRPTQHIDLPRYEPRMLSGCSTLLSADLIQLCCCEAVSCTWINLLLSLDWYQHRGVLVLH